MDGTTQETRAFRSAERNGFQGAPSGCALPGGPFLSVTARSGYSAHLTLLRKKYVPVWKLFWKHLPGGQENKTKPFSYFESRQGLNNPELGAGIRISGARYRTNTLRRELAIFSSPSLFCLLIHDLLCRGLQTCHLSVPHALVHWEKGHFSPAHHTSKFWPSLHNKSASHFFLLGTLEITPLALSTSQMRKSRLRSIKQLSKSYVSSWQQNQIENQDSWFIAQSYAKLTILGFLRPRDLGQKSTPVWYHTGRKAKLRNASTQSSARSTCSTRNKTSGLLLSSSSIILGVCGHRGNLWDQDRFVVQSAGSFSQPCKLKGWTGPGPGMPPPGHPIECPPQNGGETIPKIQGWGEKAHFNLSVLQNYIVSVHLKNFHGSS